jgi:hypothetical protein
MKPVGRVAQPSPQVPRSWRIRILVFSVRGVSVSDTPPHFSPVRLPLAPPQSVLPLRCQSAPSNMQPDKTGLYRCVCACRSLSLFRGISAAHFTSPGRYPPASLLRSSTIMLAFSFGPRCAVQLGERDVGELAMFHRHLLCGSHANRTRSSGRKIQGHAFCEWSTIIDPHNNGFSSSRISDQQTGAEGKRLMGRSEPLWVENFSRCGPASPKFVTIPRSCHHLCLPRVERQQC